MTNSCLSEDIDRVKINNLYDELIDSLVLPKMGLKKTSDERFKLKTRIILIEEEEATFRLLFLDFIN